MKIKRYIGDEEPQKTFTQEQVNSIMKAEKDKSIEKSAQNEVYKESAKLSEEQSAQISAQNEEMRQRGLTDQQKHAEALATADNKVKSLETKVTETESEWKGKFHNVLVQNELTQACQASEIHGGVHNPIQIASVLGPKTSVVDGQVVVKDFSVPLEEEGKFETQDVTPKQAVAYMSQSVEHKNLFVKLGKKGSGGSGGGDQHQVPADGPNDMASMSEFMKNM